MGTVFSTRGNGDQSARISLSLSLSLCSALLSSSPLSSLVSCLLRCHSSLVPAYERNSGREPTERQLCLGRRRAVRGERNCRYSRVAFPIYETEPSPRSMVSFGRGCFDRLDEPLRKSRTLRRVNTTVAEGTVSRSNRPRCATNLKSDQRRTVKLANATEDTAGVFDKLLPNYVVPR